MPGFLIAYVRWVEAFNARIGKLAMWSLYLLMGVLLWGAVARATWAPQVWTDEMAQFLMVGFFMLGGAWALQQGSAVRMDLAYATWSDRTKAMVDAVTILCILFYLGVMLWGGIESLQYAIDTGERRRGLWRPYMWPVKAVMVLGLTMMLLQCTAFFIRDIAKLRGRAI